jgi:putative flippase GtrA
MKRFMKFGAASLSSCAIDLFLFAVFCRLLHGKVPAYIAVSTVLARLLSASYNYAMNYKVVFQSSERVRTSGIKYVILAAVQMSLSAVLVSGGIILLPAAEEVLIKVVVDSVLFLVSYAVQKRFVFRTGPSK